MRVIIGNARLDWFGQSLDRFYFFTIRYYLWMGEVKLVIYIVGCSLNGNTRNKN